jgi:hypothetical protein
MSELYPKHVVITTDITDFRVYRFDHAGHGFVIEIDLRRAGRVRAAIAPCGRLSVSKPWNKSCQFACELSSNSAWNTSAGLS